MKKIIFLVSGNGGNLRFLYHALKLEKLKIEIIAVIGDRKCQALNFAQKNNIHTHQIHYSQKNNQKLQQLLNTYSPDLIITNWNKIIDSETLSLFPNQFLNLHYSLLPSFKGIIGMKTLEEAEKQNVQFVGNTSHIVDNFVDNGKICVQSMFCIDWKKDQKKDIISIMFQSSCLTLLNAVIIFFKIETIPKIAFYTLGKRKICINPPLKVDIKQFSPFFWEKVNDDSL